jgi:hypothetical protein
MDVPTLMLAYGAAVMVALTVTAAFAAPIEEALFRLLPKEVAPAWQQLVKFALFVVTFGGGMPAPLTGAIIDRSAPVAAPVPGESFMIVMSSFSGALMAAAWVLLVFFAVTLVALTGLRFYTVMRRRRERGEPLKRREPSDSRPVKQDRPASQPRRW